MKKALGILLVLALLLTVFVSCSQEAGQSVAEELVSVSFDGSKARALSASRDPFNADDYVWTYTAQKADASGLTTGETATEQRINTGKGLAGKVPGFSQGYWNFTLYAYAAVPGSTEGTFEPTGDALYSGTASHVKVAKGASNDVTVSVSPATTGKGYIAFDKANLALKALKSGEDINAQGDTRSVNFSYGIYAITDTTFSNNIINEGTAGKTELDAGSYFVRVSYTYDDDDDFVIADEAIVAVVYGGQTTTIKGTIGELSTDVSFGAEEVEIPSAEGESVDVPENLSEYEDTDAGYAAYQEAAGEEAIEDVELSNATPTTDATVSATVPARAVYSLLQESISEDPNTTSAMSLDLTVDINTQETTASKKAYDINLIKTVETTTTTTTGTSKSTNASLVKNVAEYVAATIKVGAGLRHVEVYHSDVLMNEVTAEQYVGDVAQYDVNEAGVYYYDDVAGVLYLKTKSFSPFVVTFTPDTIPEESKVVNVTREIGYADLQEAVDAAVAGDTLKLVADIDLPAQVVVTKKLTLDLNGKKLYNTVDLWDKVPGSWSLVSVQGEGALTITGNGTLDAKENDCYAIDVRDIGATLVVENGTIVGNLHAIYAYEGFVTVKGGSFSLKQVSSGTGEAPYRYTLNCYDASYNADKAGFTVTGGSFYRFNPADNASETGGHTNYVPEGYESVYDSVNETYSVVKLRVARIGDTYFTSLKDAFDALGTEEGTIELLADIEVDEYVQGTDYNRRMCLVDNLYYGQTLDGNGHKVVMKNQTKQTVLIGNLYGTIQNLVVEGLNGPLASDSYMGAVYNNVTIRGGFNVSGNGGGFVTYVWEGTGNELTFNNCTSELNLTGTGTSADYNAAFVGYMVFQNYIIYFNNCVNKGNVVCGSAGLFLGNVRSYNGSIYINNCRNDGTIQRTYVPEAQYRHNQILYGTTSDWGATTYIDDVKYTMAQVNAREADDAIPGNKLILGPVDSGLTLSINSGNRLVFTPINIDKVDHYVVSTGLYVNTGNGSTRFYVTHRIDASDVGESYTSIENLSYVDNAWLVDHDGATSAKASFNEDVMIVTYGDNHYYLVTNENYSTNGSHTVAPAELLAVSAFDKDDNLLGSTGL